MTAQSKKPRIIICKVCGRSMPLAARGLCAACYKKEKPKQRKRKYESHKLGKPSYFIYVPCMNCKQQVAVSVITGEEHETDKRRFCHTCKTSQKLRGHLDLGCRNENLNAHLKEAEKKWRKKHPIKHAPVHHITKDNPEYERIAKECTPPNQIKNTEADFGYYWKSDY